MMKKNAPNVRQPQNPELDSFEDGLADLRGILSRSAAAQEPRGYQEDYQNDAPYQRERVDQQEERDRYRQDGESPFLSDDAYEYDQEPEPYEFSSQPFQLWPLRRKSSVSLRILLGVLAAAGVAMMFALFTSDATRAIIANAKEAIGGSAPDRAPPPEPPPTQLTVNDLQLKDPARFSTQSIRPGAAQPAAAAYSRDVVATAYPGPPAYPNASPYQSAPQSRPSFAAPPAITPAAASQPTATEPAIGSGTRRLPADELATLMKRAKGLLASGDIPSARLLLERAADSQEPNAAFMLGQTYDPQMLGSQDARRIKPDPATARVWYERAAQLGSMEAQRRLGQMQN